MIDTLTKDQSRQRGHWLSTTRMAVDCIRELEVRPWSHGYQALDEVSFQAHMVTRLRKISAHVVHTIVQGSRPQLFS